MDNDIKKSIFLTSATLAIFGALTSWWNVPLAVLGMLAIWWLTDRYSFDGNG